MNDIDFRPQWYVTQIRVASGRKKRFALVAAVCALMIFWLLVNENRIRQANADLRNIQLSNEETKLLSTRVTELKSEIGTLRERHKRYESLLIALPPSVVLAEISHRLPRNAGLVDFHYDWLKRGALLGGHHGTAGSSGHKVHTGTPEYCDAVVSFHARGAGRQDIYEFVQNLNSSPIIRGLHSDGTASVDVEGEIYKEKAIKFYVLAADYIGP